MVGDGQKKSFASKGYELHVKSKMLHVHRAVNNFSIRQRN